MIVSTPDFDVLFHATSTTMKISLPHLLVGMGWFCASTHFLGCMPLGGSGINPYPGQPNIGYNPRPYPVGYRPFPGGPGIPIVMNPNPPGTLPNPGTVPTIPIGLPGPNPNPNPNPSPTPNPNPNPNPTIPGDDSTKFWSPWPLPPRGNQFSVSSVGFDQAAAVGGNDGSYVRRQQFDVADSTSNEDLKYRGGRTIRDLNYVNLYISGDTQWAASDVERIDASLSAAMRDKHLNNVLLQYYDNQPISSTSLPSHPLVGYTPKTVTRGDIQNYATYLHQQGFLRSYDLKNTVFNFLLPPGTVLTADSAAANTQGAGSSVRSFDALAEDKQVDSTSGLGGYHGSVAIANGGRIYFSTGVYSQRFSNGATNGIPVFNEPWKNVVATLYHQLIETRTDPDVEDANQEFTDLDSARTLGWVSDSGREIGDFAIQANIPISSVIREVPLADGSGTVPIQLPYSNFVHGPEGPISQPHPLPKFALDLEETF